MIIGQAPHGGTKVHKWKTGKAATKSSIQIQGK